MARENTKYRTLNLTKEQDRRLQQLAEETGEPSVNMLMKLVADHLRPADVATLQKRRG